MNKLRKLPLAAAIPMLATLACFDGTDYYGPQESRLRVRECVYATTISGTYVGVAKRSGWENWRDVFRPSDMLADEAVVLKCGPDTQGAIKPATSRCKGYSFIVNSDYFRGGASVEGTLVGDLSPTRARIGLKLLYLPTPGRPKHPDVWMEIPSVSARQDKGALVAILRTVESKGEAEVVSWMEELRR